MYASVHTPALRTNVSAAAEAHNALRVHVRLDRIGRLLVTIEVHSAPHPWLTVAAFPDENFFIQMCTRIISDTVQLESVLAHILRATASINKGSEWTTVDLTEEQLRNFNILNPLQTHDGMETLPLGGCDASSLQLLELFPVSGRFR